MPNVTISVPDQLKTKMDTLSEVNWSDICRKAISRYITERKNPTPNIELDLSETRLDHYSYETGYPTLTIPLRIYNKMESEITIDRILFNVRYVTEDGRQYVMGSGYDLHRRLIGSNSIGGAQILLTLFKEKIASLENVFISTFHLYIRCIVYVEGFKNPYNQEVTTRIPIDDWKQLLKELLKTSQSV